MASGDTKTQQYLDVAANGTRADLPSDTCCETRTQTLIRGVAERIMDVEDEVERLENNPDVVDIVATYADLQAYPTSQLTDKDVVRVLQDETRDGDSTYYRWSTTTQTWTYIGESKQYSDFVGTDGTAGGQNGLVPAPVATDAGKFLNANGSWEEVQAGATYTAGDGINISAQDVISATNTGKAKVLTTADYNWPVDNPTAVALWLLGPGVYAPADTSVTLRASASEGLFSGVAVVGGAPNGGQISILVATYGPTLRLYQTRVSDGYQVTAVNVRTPVNDNLTSTSTTSALSANQGRVLNEKIEGRVIQNDGAPTTSTVGTIGLVLEDTTNGKLYVCTDIDNTDPSNPVYTWKEVGSDTIKELTSADYNYPTDNPDGVAMWLLDPGYYECGESIKMYYNNDSSGTTATARFWILKDSDNRVVVVSPSGDYIFLTSINANGSSVGAAYQNSAVLTAHQVVNSLTSTSAYSPLSAAQGKILNDKIGGNLSNLTTTDKTSLINAINELNTNLGAVNTALQTLLNGTGA